MFKKVLSGLIITSAMIASASQAYVLYNPLFSGESSISYSSVKLTSYSFPSGNCDGPNLHIDLTTDYGKAIYQTYLKLRLENTAVKRIQYSWDNNKEKCYIYGIAFD